MNIKQLTKVTEGIYNLSVKLPSKMQQVNCYLIKGKNGFTVVDTGSLYQVAKDIWKQVIESGITIEKIFMTHIHIDHCGLAKWFKENYHIPVYVAKLQYEEVQKMKSNYTYNWVNNLLKKHGGVGITKNTGKIFELFPYQFEPDGLFENQQKIRLGNDLYEAIWTPGHSPDHFCFYNAEKQIMIVGDHILSDITPIIPLASEDRKNPLQDYFSSLDRIKKYSIRIALPGHGNIIQSIYDRAEDLQVKHYYRMEQILSSLRSEPKTLNRVCMEIYGDLDSYHSYAPLMTTISRTVYLESIGKVTGKMMDGKMYYKAV